MNDVSVVVITCNRAHLLRRAIESLLALETGGLFSYEIVVVDNASTDETKSVVSDFGDPAKCSICYYFEAEKGLAQARNRGVREARGEWIAFFDDDQRAHSEWLKDLFSIAIEKGVKCVGGQRQLDLPDEVIQTLSKEKRALLGEIVYPPVAKQSKHWKNMPGTGNVLVSRMLFDKVGMFDCELRSGGEDADLMTRICSAGYEIWLAPRALVYHHVPPHRLQRDYFRWVSQRWGTILALRDYRKYGRFSIIFLCCARIGQALLITVPMVAVQWLRRDNSALLDRTCHLWRTEAYVRKTLNTVAPQILRQGEFFAALDFLRERDTLSQSKETYTERE
jgi:glycosyltransferase involved in cell wall biosynthesis